MVDLSRARLLDPKWWNYFYLSLAGLENEQQRDLARANLTYYSSMASAMFSNPDIRSEAREMFGKLAYSYIDRLNDLYYPNPNKKVEEVETPEDFRDLWIEAFGGTPDSPEIAEKINQTVAMLRATDKSWQKRRKNKKAARGKT